MTQHRIDLGSLTPHGGARLLPAQEGVDIVTTRSIAPVSFNLIGDSYRRSYAALPGRYHLPFRLEMTVRLDVPSFLLFVGGGHLTFDTAWQDNRKIEDAAKPSGKPNQDHYSYNNSLPHGETVDIIVTYNTDEMQILIGGEERFYSRKQAYMKAKGRDAWIGEGFALGLAVTKGSTLSVQSITLTEYDDAAPVTRGAFEPTPPTSSEPRVKATYDSVLAALPEALRDELRAMDGFLKALRPLKFTRNVDKNGGKISYVASDFGLSYAVLASGAQSSQHFGWYIVTNGKPDTWHRKANAMEEALAEAAKSDPKLAERIFAALNDCVACYGARCLAKTPYAYNSRKLLACHGRVLLHARPEDFADVRAFFGYVNALMERKRAEGAPPPEKILLTEARKT